MPRQRKRQLVSAAPADLRIEIPEGIIQLYANAMNVVVTPWDLILLFGSIQLPETITGDGTAAGTIRIDAAVTMSPQHAKAAVKALQSVVDGYEKRFGEINMPEGK